MSWGEGEGCHYNSKAAYVQLPSILQPQSQVLSFPLPGQACVPAEEKGHCSAYGSGNGLHTWIWECCTPRKGLQMARKCQSVPFPHPTAPDLKFDS